MKKQVKVYKGYVPKGEPLKYTIEEFRGSSIENRQFGMGSTKQETKDWDCKGIVKRTITITSEDEEVK